MVNKSATNHPHVAATAVLLLGLLFAYALKGEGTSSETARYSAIMVGVALVLHFCAEIGLKDFRNLVRLDNAALLALYFITLFEFLFPQEFFDAAVSREQAIVGIDLVLVGMGALAIGRHFVSAKPARGILAKGVSMSEKELFWLAMVCFCAGHLHMWIAVGFNPLTWLSQLTGARFTQSWQRGKLGNFSTLLVELHWMTYLVPAIVAILWVRRRRVSRRILVVATGMLLLVMFSGVSLGARYQFAFYLLSFCGGFFLALPEVKTGKMLLFLVPIFVIFLCICFLVVNFRTLGVRETVSLYVFDEYRGYSGAREIMLEEMDQNRKFKFIIDRNLYPISLLPEYFPERHPFLESEILLHILVRPVPRVLWPGKPESLSVTTEGILGIESATIASTFVGEAYMAYGRWGVVLFGIGLGVLTGLWNRIPVSRSNPTMILLYSSGFIWIALAIRSVVWITVGFLPCFALYAYAWLLLPLLRGKLERDGRVLLPSQN